MSRPAFRFDLNRCTGCAACQVACIVENRLPFDRSWRQVVDGNAAGRPDAPAFHLSLACNHCEDAVCMKACPALAYSRDPDTGAVLIDAEKCMGCAYCSWVCPYDAPSYDEDAGLMEKCTFCSPGLREGQEPACVAWCPTGALDMGETREGSDGQGIPGFAEAGLGPAMEISGLAEGRVLPDMRPDPEAQALIDAMGLPAAAGPRGFSLKKEWSLLLFTWLAPALAGSLMVAPQLGERLNPYLFAGVGIALMLLAAMHLGRKGRAWRAILGWRSSWLSREIILWPAFVAAAFICLIFDLPAPWILPALVLGAASLLSMDALYSAIDAGRGPKVHSASVLLSGLLYAGLLSGSRGMAGGVLLVKLVLYLLKKIRAVGEGHALRPGLALTRAFFGFLIPILAFSAMGASLMAMVLPALLLAELVDRTEFYLDLELGSPRRQMDLDLGEKSN